MLFNSYLYLIFFVGVLGVLKSLERSPRCQHIVLLLASNVFYGYWDYRFLALIWITIAFDYNIGRWLGKIQQPGRRRLLLTLSIVCNLSILVFFKYFDFFQESFKKVLTRFHIPYDPWLLNLILPVGISFYVFQSLSYIMDVYRREIRPCEDPVVYAQFVCFFPQLVAGPIERAGHLIPQLEKPVHVTVANILSGSILIVWGLFKKTVVADLAAVYIVDPVFNEGIPANGALLWLANFAFGIQIYCDFSGYNDIARGSSRCMNIELVDNFRAPYWATNVSDFWRRWHISLSTWFRDYLYFPLGGNRKGKGRTYVNLMVTMFLCGLWHGASIQYILWGVYHGFLLIMHRLIAGDRRKIEENIHTTPNKIFLILRKGFCFLLISYGWMIFRAKSRNIPAYTILLLDPRTWAVDTQAIVFTLLTVAILFVPVWVAHWIQIRAQDHQQEIEQFQISPSLTGALVGLLMAVTFLFGSLGEGLPFIYFQF